MTEYKETLFKHPIPFDEMQRLVTLTRYAIMDTPAEAAFDHIVQLAAELFGAPMALISFVDGNREFVKAGKGIDLCEIPRDISFCAHALLSSDVFVVPDARLDPRFKNNPLVTGAPFIRFYAGALLTVADGHNIGSICIVDSVARLPLTKAEKALLRNLAQVTTDHLTHRLAGFAGHGFLKMAAAMPDAVVCTNEDRMITFWNPAAEEMFGYSHAEVIGQPLEMIVPKFQAAFRAARAAARGKAETAISRRPVELSAVRRDWSSFQAELSLTFWHDGDHRQFCAIIRDISLRKKTQERLRYLTYFDRLTALPNRTRFIEAIEVELNGEAIFSVLKIGLDEFKIVNSTMGVAAGDFVLKAAAERVVRVVGSSFFVARTSADEFAVLLHGCDEESAEAIGAKVLDCLHEPFHVNGSTCHLGASIGISFCQGPSHFDHADAVLKSALLALHHAKQQGGRRYEVFRPQLRTLAEERLKLEEELRLAFARGEFELYIQPQVRVNSRIIAGAEALLRWRHPERGLLSPAAFLQVLETSGIANEVGGWIVNTACAFAVEMAQAGHLMRVGVNLFPAQLRDEQLFSSISTSLALHRLPAELLELEITETTMLGLNDGVIESLRNLRKLGVSIAFDDYGTGFASLSLLKRYPLTRLKIDVEFVRGLLIDPDDAAIVKAVLTLGRSMGFQVIAEGVETREQLSKLTSFGCEEVQGYFFGKPMPASDFLTFVKEGRQTKAA